MGLSHTVFREKWRLWSKIANFPLPCILRPQCRALLGIWYRRWQKKQKKQQRQKFDAVLSRVDTIHQRDRRTDGQTDRQTDRHRATAKTALRRIRCAVKSFQKLKSYKWHTSYNSADVANECLICPLTQCITVLATARQTSYPQQ